MGKSTYEGPCIKAGEYRAVPLGGATTGWQIQRLATNRKTGERYWLGIERYPADIQAACMTLFEIAGAQVPGDDFKCLLQGLASLKTEICETCEKYFESRKD